MVCPKCGKVVPQGASFCQCCGSGINKTGGKRTVVAILVGIVLVITFAALLVFKPGFISIKDSFGISSGDKKNEEERKNNDLETLDGVYNACVTAAADPDITQVPGSDQKGITLGEIGNTPGLEEWYNEVMSILRIDKPEDLKFTSKASGGNSEPILIDIDKNGNYTLRKGSLSIPKLVQ